MRSSKAGPQHEKDLQRKVTAADADYSGKVEAANSHRNEAINSFRPQAVRALRVMIMECDAGLMVQLQKFGTSTCCHFGNSVEG